MAQPETHDSTWFRPRNWTLAGGKSLIVGPRGLVMGILNVTPDSFSDGGLYDAADVAVAHAKAMEAAGAAIIDIGAESTRPGAGEIDGAEEWRRLSPVLEHLAGSAQVLPLSVDTWRAETARKALQAGAHIINDVWGLQREPEIANAIADHGAGVVIMHTNRGRDALPDVIDDQIAFFERSLDIAAKAGIADRSIVLDPGFGFGKETVEVNLDLMARFEALHALGFPLLAGTSRKRFLGTITGREAQHRDAATAATSVLLRQKGAGVFRVHDVASSVDALAVCDAMLEKSGAIGTAS